MMNAFNWLMINNAFVQYRSQMTSNQPLGGNRTSVLPYLNQANLLHSTPQGWRTGDWICTVAIGLFALKFENLSIYFSDGVHPAQRVQYVDIVIFCLNFSDYIGLFL